MAKVYFKSVDSYSKTEVIQSVSKELLDKIVIDEGIKLENFIPLKVHFGEKGNNTYIASENYLGIIDYLKEKNIDSAFIETSVLYRGERNSREKHTKLALEHGFTELPIIIADGEHGEDYEEVEIDKNNFKTCKVAGEIVRSKQVIILSHFKGHALAGFGGAIKQLGMGCASIGGKLAQHANSKPNINYFKCKACNACVKKCPVSAITINKKAKIDKDKCIGCASCISVCPHGAISNSWVASISKSFNERLVEYAFAAAKNKNNIYITFVFNITKGCDCEGHSMKNIVKDLGIFASIDAVAIDMACLDMLDKTNNKTVFRRGRYTLQYAEKIGLGSSKYELIEI